MGAPGRRVLLKKNLKRSVFVEERGDEPQVLVKSFHAPGILGRSLDWLRLRQEERHTRAVSDMGLPVPQVLGRRRRDGHWELTSRYLGDAMTLEDYVEGGVSDAIEMRPVLRRAGELMACIHENCLELPDLHPGNVLLDSDGKLWLIDLSRVLFRKSPSRASMTRDLATLCAGVRERLPATLRSQFFLAWHAALPDHLRQELPGLTTLAYEIEDAARIRRRGSVRKEGDRWCRRSSRCKPIQHAKHAGFARRDFVSEELPDKLAALTSSPPALWILDRGRPWSELFAEWRRMGELEDHRLPAVRPFFILRRPEPVAVYTCTESVRPLAEAMGSMDEGASRRLAGGLGDLLGGLRDRGWRLSGVGGGALLVTEGGRVILGPGARLDEDQKGELPSSLVDSIGNSTLRVPFAEAYLTANRHSRRELKAWAEELAEGW